MHSESDRLYVREVIDKIEQILIEKGHYISTLDNADYYLCFDFGINSSTYTANRAHHVPGEKKISQGQISSFGCLNPVNYQESEETSGKYIYVPEEATFFNRYLNVTVYDAKLYRNLKQSEEIWQALASSSGSAGDLRLIINYLLKSVFNNFGIDTHKEVNDR